MPRVGKVYDVQQNMFIVDSSGGRALLWVLIHLICEEEGKDEKTNGYLGIFKLYGKYPPSLTDNLIVKPPSEVIALSQLMLDFHSGYVVSSGTSITVERWASNASGCRQWIYRISGTRRRKPQMLLIVWNYSMSSWSLEGIATWAPEVDQRSSPKSRRARLDTLVWAVGFKEWNSKLKR